MERLIDKLTKINKDDKDEVLFASLIDKYMGTDNWLYASSTFYMGVEKFKELMKAGYNYTVAGMHAMSYGIQLFSPPEEQEEVSTILRYGNDKKFKETLTRIINCQKEPDKLAAAIRIAEELLDYKPF